MSDSVVKITKKERFEALKNLIEYSAKVGVDGFDFNGMAEFCDKEIALLDARSEKAKERAAMKRAEGDELQEAVLNALTDEFATRDEITERIEGEDVTIAKVGYRLTQLCKNGQAIKEEAMLPNAEGKNRKVSVYKLA